jgi:hypothetical protein
MSYEDLEEERAYRAAKNIAVDDKRNRKGGRKRKSHVLETDASPSMAKDMPAGTSKRLDVRNPLVAQWKV